MLKRELSTAIVILALVPCLAWAAEGCATSNAAIGNADGGGPGADGGPGGTLCTACVTDNDCNGGTCAQFQGDTFCAASCATGSCPSGTTCTPESSASGEQVSVCVPDNNACGQPVGPQSDGGPPPPPPGCDAGASNPNVCGSLVGPSVMAGCNSCSSGGHTCAANGCYGGWWCNTSTNKCQAPPTSCPSSGGGGCGGGTDGGGLFDAGTGPITGQVGPNGGTVSRLFFTVIGDTRPASIDDTAGYPTAIIDQLYTDISSISPVPLFSLSTGDYQFSSTGGGQAGPQMDLYMAARSKFPGQFFPTMGNHECTGATASNCGPGNQDGTTDNYNQFLAKMLGPLSQSQPYYSININASDGSWTAKFVFVAANAWDSGQASWLTGVMGQATTYTFVVRHESSYASTAPGVTPSDQIINAAPYTLLIVGHSHTYEHSSTKEVLFGNGGAPLAGSANYGYGVFLQRSDGAIQVDAMDYQSNQPDPSFRFAVKPDGSPTQ